MAQLRSLSHIKRDAQWHTVGYKTKAWFSADHTRFEIKHHRTTIVSYDGEFLRIGTGGWFSKTTAERIRHAIEVYPIRLQLLTRDLPNRWRVADHKGNAWTIRGNSITLRQTKSGDWERA